MPMSDYLPEDIIQSILLRLPPKSLIRCTLVCKSWISLIKSSTFIQSHLSTTTDSNNKNDHHLLLLSAFSDHRNLISKSNDRRRHNWLHWDTPEFNEHSMLPNPGTFLNHKVNRHNVVGTCNGLICLIPSEYEDRHAPALIWNPCIRKIVGLRPPPTPGFSLFEYGFGYDSHANDYKILRIINLPAWQCSVPVAQVFSLAKGSWNTLDASVGSVEWLCSRSFVYLSGCLHILGVREVSGHHCFFLASFDMSTELFEEISMPKALVRRACTVSKYAGSLALIKFYPTGVVNHNMDIWVMKEYGVAESWSYLYTIDVHGDWICGFKRCGEVVLQSTRKVVHSELASVDPNSKKFKEYRNYFMDSFVESLILLDHASATSY